MDILFICCFNTGAYCSSNPRRNTDDLLRFSRVPGKAELDDQHRCCSVWGYHRYNYFIFCWKHFREYFFHKAWFIYSYGSGQIGKVLGSNWEKFHGSIKKYLIIGGIIVGVILIFIYLYRSYKQQIAEFIVKSLENLP